MLRPSLQASRPRAEWEAGQRARGGSWADGTIRVLRLTWYLDPVGPPPGVYAAFDFRGDRQDGTMDCRYVPVRRAAAAVDFTNVRTATPAVPPAPMEAGVPKAHTPPHRTCYLAKGITPAICTHAPTPATGGPRLAAAEQTTH